MEGDYNDEGTDNEHGWPTAVLDHGQAVQMEIEDHEEHQRCVAVCGLLLQCSSSLCLRQQIHKIP